MKVILENNHRLDIDLEFIPLDKYNCYLFSMFKNGLKQNFSIYQKECSIIFNFFNDLGYHVIFYGKSIEDFEDINNLDIISKLVGEDILVVVFNY